MVALEQNEYNEAAEHLTKALHNYMDLEEDWGIAEVKFHQARIALDCGEYENAEMLLAECLALRQLLADQQGVAATKYYQASLRFTRNEINFAKTLLDEALNVQQQIANNRETLPTYRLLAQVSAKRQEFDQALDYCRQAERICTMLEDQAELATVYYTTAIIERRRAHYRSAKEYALRALTHFQKFGLRRLEGMTLYQLAAIQKELQENDAAIAHAQTSIELFDTVQNRLGKLASLLLIGDLHRMLERTEESIYAWKEAYQLATELQHADMLAQLQDRLSATNVQWRG